MGMYPAIHSESITDNKTQIRIVYPETTLYVSFLITLSDHQKKNTHPC